MLGDDAIKAIYDANLRETLLKTYDSVSYDTVYYDIEGNPCLTVQNEIEGTSVEYYRVNEDIYMNFDYSTGIMTRYDGDDESASQYVDGPGESVADYYREKFVSVALVYSEEEKVESVTVEDGDVLVESTLPKEYVIELNEGSEESPVHSMEDSDIYKIQYVLNAEDLAMKEIKEFILKEDGTKVKTIDGTTTYNKPQLTPPEKYTEVFSDPEKVTITTVFDAGTEEEQTFTAQAPRNAAIYVWRDEALYDEAYDDPECTVPYSGRKEDGGMLLYFAKGK